MVFFFADGFCICENQELNVTKSSRNKNILQESSVIMILFLKFLRNLDSLKDWPQLCNN